MITFESLPHDKTLEVVLIPIPDRKCYTVNQLDRLFGPFVQFGDDPLVQESNYLPTYFAFREKRNAQPVRKVSG